MISSEFIITEKVGIPRGTNRRGHPESIFLYRGITPEGDDAFDIVLHSDKSYEDALDVLDRAIAAIQSARAEISVALRDGVLASPSYRGRNTDGH